MSTTVARNSGLTTAPHAIGCVEAVLPDDAGEDAADKDGNSDPLDGAGREGSSDIRRESSPNMDESIGEPLYKGEDGNTCGLQANRPKAVALAPPGNERHHFVISILNACHRA